MDPSGQVFPKSRRYYRQHCTKVFSHREDLDTQPAAFLAKDLRVVGRPLNEVILVDDTASSGILQPDNTILIPTWTGDPSDDGLLVLANNLDRIANSHSKNTK
jgi:RNA polymerase II subunit A small phosphatase-like protein